MDYHKISFLLLEDKFVIWGELKFLQMQDGFFRKKPQIKDRRKDFSGKKTNTTNRRKDFSGKKQIQRTEGRIFLKKTRC